MGFALTGHQWPADTTVTMQLELGPTNVSLIDGLGTWNNSAADALAVWNQSIELIKFAWVSDSTAPKGSPDGYNSVFFSNTIFGEGFGDNTLAVTVIWYSAQDYTIETEADVVFNTAQTFNSYRGPELSSSFDFHRIALHEFGHVLGLAHVYNDPPGQALMEPYISDLDHLAPDDLAGAVFLYGYRITSPSYFNGLVVGGLATFFIQTNNNPTSFTAIGLPSGLVLNSATGEIKGTPLEAGTFEVTVTAHGFPRDVSATITIEIGAAQITSTPYPDAFQVGTSFSYTITAGNSPTSFTASGLPPGLVLDGKTGVISGVVALSGGYTISVIAHGAQYDAAGQINLGVTRAFREMVDRFFPPGNITRTIKDPARDRLYVLAQFGLMIIDTKGPTVITTVALGPPYDTHDMSMSLDGTKLWVLSPALHAVSLVDFSILPDVPGGPFYGDSVREGANHKLYLTSSTAVLQVDETTGTSVTVLAPEPGTSFGKFVEMTPDGKTMFLADKFARPSPISRYDISGAIPLFKAERFASGYIFRFTISPDGKLLGYSTDNDFSPGNVFTFTLPTANLQAQPQPIDRTTDNGSLTFGSASSVGYFTTVVNDIPQFSRLDFIGTASGLPFNEWTLPESGAAFEDGAGKYLFISSEGTIDVYSLASDALPGVTPAPKSLLNVSTRSVVGIDDARMIGGFIISGDTTKKIAVRAIGPSLPLATRMANPTLSVYDSSGALVVNDDNWNQNHDQLVSAGLDPWDEHDAGLIATLAPGSYTTVVSIEDGAGGVGLVELYDLSADNSGKVANISTRARVGTGDNVLIGGFIVGGNEPTKVIARAIGPSLASSDVTGVLLNPVLDLYDGSGVGIASNDDWRSTQEAEIVATGIPPTDDRESAIVATLSPGAYTALVRGQNDTTGIALVEIYNLDFNASGAK